MWSELITGLVWIIVILILAAPLWKSWRNIGPTEVGLVRKRFSFSKLVGGSPVAMNGEAGYQAELLSPGWRFKLWPLYAVTKHPMVQVPAGQIGVVISQVGKSLPIGAKSGIYKPEFGNFQDLKAFISGGGEKGVQRPVLNPGTVAPIHPVAFLVLTKDRIFGLPIDEDVLAKVKEHGKLSAQAFGLKDEQLMVQRIEPKKEGDGKIVDMIGIVTTFDGAPLPGGAIANRLGDFDDIAEFEKNEKTTHPAVSVHVPAVPVAVAPVVSAEAKASGENTEAEAVAVAAETPPGDTVPEAKNTDSALVEIIITNKNVLHNNYQDFQAFITAGGKIGLQHDPLLYGAYTLNPFLVAVEMVPMLVINQGEVAVVKSYVGLATEDTSGSDFKFGSLVRPGHRGVWRESLRTGKYPLNPRCYSIERVPTSILVLNWAEATSKAHDLDKDLQQIVGRSKEGFVSKIDLQVQIHVSDTKAPKVISMVGSMRNLVNEVLQAAVGNHFRDKLQGMPAVDFIQTRSKVQQEAETHIRTKLNDYMVETRGVYIQDVIPPDEIVEVLKAREIANQQKTTYKAEEDAQGARMTMESAKGKADQQAALAKSEVGITIASNAAEAVKKTADGEAYRVTETGKASAVPVREQGLAIAKGLEAQRKAVGRTETMAINIVRALAESKQPIVPSILTMGEGGGLEALLMKLLNSATQDDEKLEDTPDVIEEVREHEAPAAHQPSEVPPGEVDAHGKAT